MDDDIYMFNLLTSLQGMNRPAGCIYTHAHRVTWFHATQSSSLQLQVPAYSPVMVQARPAQWLTMVLADNHAKTFFLGQQCALF